MIRSAIVPPSQEELLAAVALDIQTQMQAKHNPAKDFQPKSAPTAAAEILDELRAVDGIVAAKATPEETEAFRNWLIVTAQAAADAAKEGGFMGFGAERVSAGEQAMLGQTRRARAGLRPSVTVAELFDLRACRRRRAGRWRTSLPGPPDGVASRRRRSRGRRRRPSLPR